MGQIERREFIVSLRRRVSSLITKIIEQPMSIMVSYNTMPNNARKNGKAIRIIDLFCGIGGFRISAEQAANEVSAPIECVFSCDIDVECRKAYKENFSDEPVRDITEIKAEDIPDHDV